MRRREFITLIGGAAAWPIAASAQQPAMPVIGILSAFSAATAEKRMAAFREGLGESGYVESRNVLIVYLQADGEYDSLPTLAADLVRRHVSVIVSPQSSVAAIAARDATTVIPIIFSVPVDPVMLGLVSSLSRPAGNVTGVYSLGSGLAAKRLGLLRELLPHSKVVAVLFNPATPANNTALPELQAAASAIGQQLRVVNAITSREIDMAFEALAAERPDALLVVNDLLFSSLHIQIVVLAARHAIPVIYTSREYVDAGGLMSYGTSFSEVYRQIGIYTGRALKGVKPADMPVVMSTKFEFVLNLQTARTLGIDVPPALFSIADEVIE
jgi:putative ABC transport system substrate-binding protein